MEIQELVQESSSPYLNNNDGEKRHLDTKNDVVHFIVDDLLDFPSDDVLLVEEEADNNADTSTTDSSSTALDSSNSSPRCGGDHPASLLAGDEGSGGSFVDTELSNLYVPNDDLAEFEWLSNFMEESFSNEDLQKLQLISGVIKPPPSSSTFGCRQTTMPPPPPVFNNVDITHVPGKARTKRSRVVSSSNSWASSTQLHQVMISPIAHVPSSNYDDDNSNNNNNNNNNMLSKPFGMKKKLKTTTNDKEYHDRSYISSRNNEDGRKCLHCATDKTPQWRSGPMGPKTLCNACGVRYKSGRLVPEYRPASSPTFVLTKHSNSHRKVLELQRQKVQKSQHHHQQQQFMYHQNAMLPIHDGAGVDYLKNHNTSHDYRQLI